MSKLPKLVRWILSVGFILLVTFTLMRLGLFFMSDKGVHSTGKLGSAFFLGLRYDLRYISILLIVMLVLGSFRFLHPFISNRGRIFWMVILALVIVFILIFFAVDFAHYAYLQQRLNASVLNYLEDAGISMTMVWQSYPVVKLSLGLLVAVFALTWFIRRAYRRIGRNNYPVARRTRIVSFIALFLIFGFFIFGRFNQYPLRWSDAFDLGSDYNAAIALNPFESFFNTLKFRNDKFDAAKVKELIPVLSKYYGFAQHGGSDSSIKRTILPKSNGINTKPNIVLVICESFSAYKSSMWGNPLKTTPFFDSLCREGIFFDHCFTPSYGTARGVWAVVTGIPDVEPNNRTASRNPLAVDQHSIINDFKDYGKFYFIGGSSSWANIRGVLKNNIEGLRLYEKEDYDAAGVDVWGISDKNLFLESNKVLAAQDKPFFAVIQTADNHRPYTIPKEDQAEFVKISMPDDSLKQYGFENSDEMNAFRFTDYCYRKFMEAAKKEKYYNNTIFVFVGDHGIPGEVGNMFPRSWTEQRLTSVHVPMLFYAPGLIKPQRLHNICSQVDILPTIAGLSNIPYTNTTLGRDLLDSTVNNFAFFYDPDNNMAGVIKGDYFFRRQLNNNKEELVSVINNDKPLQDSATTAAKNDMRLLTNTIYEVSKYLLLNNKK